MANHPEGRSRRRRRIALGAALLAALGLLLLAQRTVGPLPVRPGIALDAPAPLARWPWAKARKEAPHPGLTHWVDRSSPDGTVLDLLAFDFPANPRLRLGLYDQDEDDAVPHDNGADYWPRGVGHITRHLNAAGRGKVVAAWNGTFFTTDHKSGGHGIGRHVAPMVLRGKVFYNVGNHRWAFGVQYRDGKPEFKTIHLPDRATLAREFAFAAGGAQCLVREGRPLRLQPFPTPGAPPLRQPVPSTPEEAGHIPTVDHMRTSRTSMAWSKDHRRFYLLIVKEPDSETASIQALRRGVPLLGGWTVADLQRFWLSLGAWGAVNIDGGEVTQMVHLRADSRYEMVPPRWATPQQRLTFAPSFPNAPQGGSLSYFYVTEVPARR